MSDLADQVEMEWHGTADELEAERYGALEKAQVPKSESPGAAAGRDCPPACASSSAADRLIVWFFSRPGRRPW